MNITHAEEEKVTGDRLEAIFTRQHELAEKYTPIEVASGLRHSPDVPVDLDSPKGQAQLKDYAWRVVEEIGEALDARVDANFIHEAEEVVDALHFLCEFTIIAGCGVDDLHRLMSTHYGAPERTYKDRLELMYLCSRQRKTVPVGANGVIRELGMTCNTLKCKPWKQSHQLTDKEEFHRRLIRTWVEFLVYAGEVFSGDFDELVNVYLKKSQVNSFRIRSNY
jgi:hypothetical protein